MAHATLHAITLGAPHAGSEVGDLCEPLANSLFTSWIVSLVDNNSNSAKVLTTSHLAYANSLWLRDGDRSVPIYTVAGATDFGRAATKDALAFAELAARVPFPGPNDGYVTAASAHAPGAPGGDWFTIDASHDELRSSRAIGELIGRYGWPTVRPVPTDLISR